LHGFSEPLGLKWEFFGGGGDIDPRRTFGGSYVCANFGENRSRNATVRVSTDEQIHTLTHWMTDATRFY